MDKAQLESSYTTWSAMVNIMEKILSFLITEFSTKEESFQKLERLKFQQIQTSVTYYKDSALIKLSKILIQ